MPVQQSTTEQPTNLPRRHWFANVWFHCKQVTAGVFRFISLTCFIAAALSNILRLILPPLSILASGANAGFYVMGYLLWALQLNIDPSVAPSHQVIPKKVLKKIAKQHKWSNINYRLSAIIGLIFGGITLAIGLLSPVGWLLVGLAATACVCYIASNVLWITGARNAYLAEQQQFECTKSKYDELNRNATHAYQYVSLHSTIIGIAITVSLIAMVAFPPSAALILTVALIASAPFILATTWYYIEYTTNTFKAYLNGDDKLPPGLKRQYQNSTATQRENDKKKEIGPRAHSLKQEKTDAKNGAPTPTPEEKMDKKNEIDSQISSLKQKKVDSKNQAPTPTPMYHTKQTEHSRKLSKTIGEDEKPAKPTVKSVEAKHTEADQIRTPHSPSSTKPTM